MSRAHTLPFLLSLALAPACSAGREVPTVIGPEGVTREPVWSAEELAKETAVRLVRKTAEESHHWLRTTVSEKPHTHEKSDLTSVVLGGSTRMHVGDQVYDLQVGDVVHIPRGVPHWLELLSSGPARAYVIFAPAFDPSDRRFIQ
jgi:mannose-6-phosphate isomerase-like protein (cupin superfamily)